MCLGELTLFRDAPLWGLTPYSWSRLCAWSPLSLAAVPLGWGLLSSGKLPAASLPGSFHGWDPTESLAVEGGGKVSGTSGPQAEQLDSTRMKGPGGRFPAGATGTTHLGKCSSLGQGIYPPPLLVPELPESLTPLGPQFSH